MSPRPTQRPVVSTALLACAAALVLLAGCAPAPTRSGASPPEPPEPSEPPEPPRTATPEDEQLAREILADPDLPAVLDRARKTIATGFNAGDGYGEVWIRDLATFIGTSCEVQDPAEIRAALLVFFRFQGEDGNVIDGYIPKEKAGVGYEYIRSPRVPALLGHKNTVETDQESSLVHAVRTYVRATGDRTILEEVVDDRTVLERLEMALEFLVRDRLSEEHGLLWGATTTDWGDVQPEHEWGVVLDESSHRAIDIYDNAMFLIAIRDYLELAAGATGAADSARRWREIATEVRRNVRTHLWDAERGKFIPHVYLDGSPFPADFDEGAIFYHGGTAVAIEADLLSPEEIRASLESMVRNVRESGAPSIGLTLYPPYPAGYFKNPSMAVPYSYQNGGDWTWFGGRMIQTLIRHGLVREAYRELRPMVRRVIENDGFYEWYRLDGTPSGSGTFRGSAGVLAKAIRMLLAWADEHAPPAE